METAENQTEKQQDKPKISISKIMKRDGRIVDFDRNKIINAISKAFEAVEPEDTKAEKKEETKKEIEKIADKCIEKLQALCAEKYAEKKDAVPHVEEMQDTIELVLMQEGLSKEAKSFILYRQKRSEQREEKKAVLGGIIDDAKLSLNALKILEKRYLTKDENGKTIETPCQMFRRVAENIAKADREYSASAQEAKETADKFYDMMKNLEFLPNSPTLMNAGTKIQQLSACFVLPVEDSIEEVFDALKNAALIHKSGGGTGFSFSRIRPKGDAITTTNGIASGPISFMKIFNEATEAIKQGGKRRGANMGILRIDHPDILEFINLKSDGKTLNNFNISVAITNKFMKALEKNDVYELVNPHDKRAVGEVSAKAVFDNLVTVAWKCGDPGIVFIDRINDKSPVKNLGEIEATNPCGEQALLPFESCNLGSINLTKFFADNKEKDNKEKEGREKNDKSDKNDKNDKSDKNDFDWDKLKVCVHNAVHFLDNVIDVNKFPVKEIAVMTKKTRRIGLGIMGFADCLYKFGISYDSEEATKLAEKLMKFIFTEAKNKSSELAEKRGCFPGWEGSEYEKKGIKMRNATVTSIAPTGTLSMIADISSSIEPNFAICYTKTVMGGMEMTYTNPYLEDELKKRGLYSLSLMKEAIDAGSIQLAPSIPRDMKKVFITAMEISPEWHIKMQAAFQKHVDGCISKTINFPKSCTIDDVKKAYLMAWELGCKGTTIYRDTSMEEQVLNVRTLTKNPWAKAKKKKKKKKEEKGKKECKSCAV